METTNDSNSIFDIIQSLSNVYEPILCSNAVSLLGEYKIWQNYWQTTVHETLPDSVINVLKYCDQITYPGLHLMLNVLAALSVSVASAERSFSTLRRLKTWLRTSMNEERLTGLALLHIHFDIPVDIESIIERFSTSKTRKLDFVL